MYLQYNDCVNRLRIAENERKKTQEHFDTLYKQQQQQQQVFVSANRRPLVEASRLSVSNSQPRMRCSPDATNRGSMSPLNPTPTYATRHTEIPAYRQDIAVDGPMEDDGPISSGPKSTPNQCQKYHQPPHLSYSTSAPEVHQCVAASELSRPRVPADGLEETSSSSEKLECPQCLREFKPSEKKKFDDHCKKCMM